MHPALGRRPWARLLTSLLVLAGCGEQPAPAPAVPGPVAPTAGHTEPVVFRYAMNEVPTGFDPLKASSIYASTVVVAVHDTLYRYRYLARPVQLAPNLAADLPEISPDGLTWRIRLKPGVRFADDPAFPQGRGRTVVAADVVYSFKRHFLTDGGSEGSWLWQDVLAGAADWKQDTAHLDAPWEAVVAEDEHTVVFHLAKPFPQLSHTLTQGYAAIVAREAVEHYGADLPRHPVGSGPFVLRSFDGVVARLERNPGYRQEAFSAAIEGPAPEAAAADALATLEGRSPPFVDRLEIHFLSDDGLKLASFRRGDLDLAPLLPRQVFSVGSTTPAAEFTGCCHSRLEPQNELLYLAFNMRDPELGRSPDAATDQRRRALRCAIGQAYDWHARNRVLNDGTGTVFRGHVPPLTSDFDEGDRLVGGSADPAGARALLAAHGWTAEQLPVLRFASTAGTEMQQAFELLRANLMEIGWPQQRIVWESFPTYGAFLAAVNDGRLMLMDLGWHLDYPDALNALQLFYGPYAPPQVNAGAYANPAFDAKYVQAASLPEHSTARRALVREMEALLRADCATVTGYARNTLLVWRRDALVWPGEMLGGHFLKFAARRASP